MNESRSMIRYNSHSYNHHQYSTNQSISHTQQNDTLTPLVKTKRGLNEGIAAIYFKQILGVLNYLHMKGIVHQDLRLEIFQLQSDDQHHLLKLTSLLNCRIQKQKEEIIKSTKQLCYPTSPYYYPPETAQENRYSIKSDMYSAGMMLYIMLVGRPPFIIDK